MKRLYAFAFLCSSLFACAHAKPTSTLVLSHVPKEIYGAHDAPIKVRLGNGAAGVTGILRALAEDFLAESHAAYAIAWHQNISRLSLEALKTGEIDIALTYERDQEDAYVKAGVAAKPVLIFNDHFVIVGPKKNPASVLPSDQARVVFDKIAQHGKKVDAPVFLSRNDDSATNCKEKDIWESAGLRPWEAKMPRWYVTDEVFPRDALIHADARGLYTIIDQGTWLFERARLQGSVLHTRGGELLRNSCNALTPVNPSPETAAFMAYLSSPRAQKVIADFGKSENDGEAYFTPAAEPDFAVLQH